MATIPVEDLHFCPFCGNLTYFKQRLLYQLDNWVDVFACAHCPHNVEISMYSDVEPCITMYVGINGKNYAVDIQYECDIHEVNTKGSWIKCILTLPFIPNWTPTNIEAKLHTALTFL